MKVRVVWIGKTRSKELSTLIEDFVERLRRFVTIDITEIRDPKAGDDQRNAVPARVTLPPSEQADVWRREMQRQKSISSTYSPPTCRSTV